MLRAIDAPALGILRKEDALVLAKGLLKARCGDVKNTVKSDLTALLGAMGRAHGFDEPTRAVLRVVAFFHIGAFQADRSAFHPGSRASPPSLTGPLPRTTGMLAQV